MIAAPGRKLWKVYGSSVRFDKFFRLQASCLNHNVFNPMAGDCLLLHGGVDIWPGLYGETPLPECETKNILARDVEEHKMMEIALENNVPILGICRGAQHLCVFAGGSLFQHADGHSGAHPIITSHGELFDYAPANHHQIMRPSAAPMDRACVYDPLAWSPSRLNKVIKVGKEASPPEDYEEAWELEVVWFPAVRGLAIQPHPEWGHGEEKGQPFQNYVDRLVEEYILS